MRGDNNKDISAVTFESIAYLAAVCFISFVTYCCFKSVTASGFVKECHLEHKYCFGSYNKETETYNQIDCYEITGVVDWSGDKVFGRETKMEDAYAVMKKMCPKGVPITNGN